MIGMEVHVQLRTRSKMFCGCPVHFGAPPNSLVCPVCLGLPGTLPVPNRDAIGMALSLATALGCEIAPRTKFDRKHYYYPDLPKGYQISQYDLPLALGGRVEIVTERGGKEVPLRRLHVEEDVGKSLHEEEGRHSRVDYNRAGTPLVEIVSEPALAAPEEARAFVNALRTVIRYLDVSDANMEQGNLRCEPNVNLHIEHEGGIVETPVVEVKNLNSVRNLERALRIEIERQLADFAAQGPAVSALPRATRGYDDARDVTYLLRDKEEVRDYRYFPEPDIPPLAIGAEWRRAAAARVPELPAARRQRFATDYGLSSYDADALCREPETAEYFERAVEAGCEPKPAANWIVSDLAHHAHEHGTGVPGLGLAPARLAALLRLVAEGTVTRQAAAREILPRLLGGHEDPVALVESLGLRRIDDPARIEKAARRALAADPAAAADYRAGKKKAIGRLMGAVMRDTGGRADAAAVRSALERLLKENR